MNRLLYSKQFILGPHWIETLPSWKKLKVGRSFYLTVHPDLNTYQANDGDRSITLLGSIFDPRDPEAGDNDILEALLANTTSSDKIIEHTYGLGGRWIMLVDDGQSVELFNDATGLRQVFYTDNDYIQDLWCSSQPGIIAEMLGLEMSGDAVEYINSYQFRTHKEFRWPGSSSPYREIHHLLPNHSLNLENGISRRYWPDRPLEEISLGDAIDQISTSLSSLLESMANRFDVAISLTAGLDSRLVLAASKRVRDKVSYMTVRQIDKPEDHADVVVPSLLLSGLGLNHDVPKSSLLISSDFLTVFKKNVVVPHYIYAPDAYAILRHYSQEKVAVTGGVSEVGRWSFRSQLPKSHRKNVSPEDLAKLQKVRDNQFAIDCFGRWLHDLNDTFNLDVLDLFEWEQGHGNWLANCQLEFDIAWKDIFTPFNCRTLLATMLSVHEKYRKPPRHELHHELIRRLWPEVLTIPINPHEKGRRRKLFPVLVSLVPGFLKQSLKRLSNKRTKENDWKRVIPRGFDRHSNV